MVSLCLAGDVMLGRGVDQILPHPGGRVLRERYVSDARTYVRLAEAENGPVGAPVGFDYPWGEVLSLLDAWTPDARVLNLETSVTVGDDVAPGKGIHYRMHPDNIGCLAAAQPDACMLANNHVLDLGVGGLTDTLVTLRRVGLEATGAGESIAHAQRPIRVEGSDGDVLVWSVAATDSGVPQTWAATEDRPGIALLADLSRDTAEQLVRRVQDCKRPGDVAVVSIHWGTNWGYRVPRSHVRFAHRLVDGGVDVVHGHSSHHPRPVEVYRGKLVLYGCGDLVSDYEGITGHEEYRGELRLLYRAELAARTGELRELRMAPLRSRRLRLEPAAAADAHWLAETLSRAGRRFGTSVEVADDGDLLLRPG